jgi:hypothetical protein
MALSFGGCVVLPVCRLFDLVGARNARANAFKLISGEI